MEFRSVIARDAAVQAAAQSWVPMECYQLTKGNRVAQLDILDLGPQQIVRERQEAAVQKLGAMPKGPCTISVSRLAKTRFSEIREDDNETVFFLPDNTEYDIYVPPESETAYVRFDQEEFLQAARILDPEGWENAPRQVARLHTPRKAAMWEAVDLCLRIADGEAGSVPRTGELQKTLFDTVMQIATAVPPGTATDLSHSARMRAPHIGRAARAFIMDRLDDDHLPGMIDICRELGVSERTLQYAFLDYAGLSPTAYLRRVRLNRVREALRGADAQTATVTETAMRFGFLHLGRFARDYRMFFGERPSQTLAS
ncbi:helix-turn-helix domain-containing protein [Oricola thermophila]|uniref:Helix-turn-helix domain-containing protein n=1 Tax=Oricola thermophila TaxID=2742145 RepID=A0A6N1VBR7_9HYPH|nr:helix-turn-helix domain-containing protein [Oricola thermophila]QKV18446.1 helix-turn-helix domain-containing protein [Oricola thermophila]